jgi:hypothetical protein
MGASRTARASEHEYSVNATTEAPGVSSGTRVLQWTTPAGRSAAGAKTSASLNGIAVA